MPMLISTGKCPSPSGRNTSALSRAPSRIGTSTSFSTFILWMGSDSLAALRVTCSCTLPPDSFVVLLLRGPPHLARGLDDEAQLGDLARNVHGIAADAAGEAALRAQRQLLERRVLRRLVDASLELVFGLELAALGSDQSEHCHFALRKKTQRLEAAGAGAVIFEEIAVDADL